jgi:hypothetical protein
MPTGIGHMQVQDTGHGPLQQTKSLPHLVTWQGRMLLSWQQPKPGLRELQRLLPKCKPPAAAVAAEAAETSHLSACCAA